jgi:hypothetical protein
VEVVEVDILQVLPLALRAVPGEEEVHKAVGVLPEGPVIPRQPLLPKEIMVVPVLGKTALVAGEALALWGLMPLLMAEETEAMVLILP